MQHEITRLTSENLVSTSLQRLEGDQFNDASWYVPSYDADFHVAQVKDNFMQLGFEMLE